jgi:hypothetical protein
MNKRNLATVLWFLMGWTVGSMLAIVVGLPSILGVLMGIPFAAFIRRGPARRVWSPDALAARHERSAPSAPLATD